MGKSLFSLDLAAAIASGRAEFLGDEDEREPARVLYVDQENSLLDIHRRLYALGLEAPDLANLVYLSFPPFEPLNTQKGAEALLAAVAEHKADVVVLDTISRMIVGVENDSEPWLALYRYLHVKLKAQEVACIRLDHFGKDTEKGQRGSSAKTQDIDAVWELRAVSSAGPGRLSLKRTHTRTGLGPDRLDVIRQGAPGEKGTTAHILASDVLDPFFSGNVGDAIAALDREGVPNGLGRDRLQAEALRRGLRIKLSNKCWSDVARIRKAREPK